MRLCRQSFGFFVRSVLSRILRKYGYSPDKQEKATQTVLMQAEMLSHEWAVA
ncbi:MAG: type I restriction enzyme endonuclease domain-containing protein [Methanomethylovorans sp.]|uniref:type I restriction enzyme endonuclease domain-containing protein n=1 Tax=Methanomethylovorans sp. TaxID=2758717 RepID=UPI001BD65C19|nr:type I restriction enzyme endonuclease domain-containing protein [Methanomethylovorans sp.]